MEYNRPTDEQVARLKEQFSERSLHLVECVDGDDTYVFVMTGATELEHKRFTEEMLDASAKPSAKLKEEAGRIAAKRAVLFQIRHPDIDESKKILESKPLLVYKLADKLNEHAGENVEVRSKKL